MNRIFLLALICVLFASCEQKKKNQYDPYSITDVSSKKQSPGAGFEVDFKKTGANLKTIHIKLNDTNGYDAIFDTGCSGMLISALEFRELIKSKTITVNDYKGNVTSSIADGSEIINATYNIRSITVVDKNGKSHTLNDIRATVVENIEAEILIGSSVIDNLAKNSYTVDLNKKVIRFQ